MVNIGALLLRKVIFKLWKSSIVIEENAFEHTLVNFYPIGR